MILFLDTVSPLPEFSLIGDNKIIFSKKIINNHHEKMSDYLIKSYTDLEKKFSLDQKLENLIINIGPGSYTSLRIGIAFFSGLCLSYQIDLKGIPCVDFYKYIISKDDLLFTGSILILLIIKNLYVYMIKKKNIIIFIKLKVLMK